MGEILLIAADWQFRALVRSELLEEGYRVTALPSLGYAVAFLRRTRERPQVIVLDARGMEVGAGALPELSSLTGESAIVFCDSRASRSVSAQEDAEPAVVLLRPFTVGEVVEEVRKLIPWPEQAGRGGVDSISRS